MAALIFRLGCCVFFLGEATLTAQFMLLGHWWDNAVSRSVAYISIGTSITLGLTALMLRSVSFSPVAGGYVISGALVASAGTAWGRMRLLRRLHGAWLPKYLTSWLRLKWRR